MELIPSERNSKMLYGIVRVVRPDRDDGAAGLVISSVLFGMTRTQGGGTHTMHSETSDSQGNSVVQNKVQT